MSLIQIILLVVLLGILCFLAIMIIRAVLYRPYQEEEVLDKIEIKDRDRVIESISGMIQIKTISYHDKNLVDWAEFERFRAYLEKRYPLVHKHLTLTKLGETGLLYHLKGKSDQEPRVLMSHYDVVPVQEEGWVNAPFDGLVEEGTIWGRGTLDTKGTMCGIMEALEQLLADHYVPAHDLYLSFSGDEEVEGESCPAIVKYLEEKGIRPAFVLDEGGAVVSSVFPGVEKSCALIGVGEKVGMHVELAAKGQGGHSSTPPPHTTTGQIAKAVVRLEKKPFAPQFVKPVREMFDTLGRESTFAYKLIFANLWCFLPLLQYFCKMAGGELNAMMRTTCAVTKLEGSKAINVIPPKATAGINLRLLGKDTAESSLEELKQKIGDPSVEVKLIHAMTPSGYSDTECEEWKKLKQVVKTNWPEAIVAPYLMLACSDSRHYSRITDRIYKFSAMALSKEERALIHGNNERVPVETMMKTVEFYLLLLQTVC